MSVRPESIEDLKIVLETVLLASGEPLDLSDMKRLFEEEISGEFLLKALDSLAEDWNNRGVELVCVANGWRFQTRTRFREYLERLRPEKPPKYSRAFLETLAIIAYKQPVTRGDIEALRGVAVSSQIVKTLEDRGWVRAIGHKEAPGRPALYGTTTQFLDDLCLRALDQLPPLEDLRTLVELVPETPFEAETTIETTGMSHDTGSDHPPEDTASAEFRNDDEPRPA